MVRRVPERAAGLGHACGGRGQEGSARPGAAPPRQRPGPRSPARALAPRRQALDPAGRGSGLPLSIRGRPAAGERRRRGLENPGAPAPEAAARGAAGPLPLAPALAAARLGAHPGPSRAGELAEAGAARQHPLGRPRAERSQPSPRAAPAAPGPRALQAPGGGRRPSLPAVTALSTSASRSWGVGRAPRSSPAGRWGKEEKGAEERGGESRRGPGGPALRHWAASWRRLLSAGAGVGGGQEGWAKTPAPRQAGLGGGKPGTCPPAFRR